jgi:hypothetical protein
MARLFTGYTKYKLATSAGIQNQDEDKDTSSFSQEDVRLNINFNGFQAIALLNTDPYLSSLQLTVL